MAEQFAADEFRPLPREDTERLELRHRVGPSGLGFDGFRLRPAEQPYDLARISRELVPELQRRGSFREQYREKTLRERLGLPRPVNRYEAA